MTGITEKELFEKFEKAYLEKRENKRGNPLFRKKPSGKEVQRYYEEWIKENKKKLEKLNYKEVLTIQEFYEKYAEALIKKAVKEKPNSAKKIKEYFENLKELNIFDDLVIDLAKRYLNIEIQFFDPLVFISS